MLGLVKEGDSSGAPNENNISSVPNGDYEKLPAGEGLASKPKEKGPGGTNVQPGY